MKQTVINNIVIPAEWLIPLKDSFTERQLRKPYIREALLILYLLSQSSLLVDDPELDFLETTRLFRSGRKRSHLYYDHSDEHLLSEINDSYE